MTLNKAAVDKLIDAGLVLSFVMIFINVIERLDKLEAAHNGLRLDFEFEKDQRALADRQHEAERASRIKKVTSSGTPFNTAWVEQPAPAAKRAPRKTAAAKKTTARKKAAVPA